MALDWNETMNDFARYLTLERNLSDNTVQSYLHDIASFSEFVTTEFPYNSSPDEITEQHIEQFLCSIYDNGLKATSQARIVSGLKSFFKFLLIKGRIQTLPTESVALPKQERNLPKVLSVEEVIAIIDAIDLSDPLGHRNRAIIELMYGCGLRVSEAITLKTSDLFFNDGFIRVIGKGDKMRLVPVNSTTVKMVNIYLEQRRAMPNPSNSAVIFLNRLGKPLSRMMIFNIIRRYATQAGITKQISPHTLRHSFATHLLQNGADIRVIQELLGHQNISTTEIYTHLDKQSLHETIAKYHPLGR